MEVWPFLVDNGNEQVIWTCDSEPVATELAWRWVRDVWSVVEPTQGPPTELADAFTELARRDLYGSVERYFVVTPEEIRNGSIPLP